MNDLRNDPEAHAADPRVVRINELRTVSMPDLRTADARQLDAETRDLRTCDQRMHDEIAVLREAIERLADSVTVLMLERELCRLEREGKHE